MHFIIFFGFSSDFLFEERHRIIPNMHYNFVFAHFIFIFEMLMQGTKHPPLYIILALLPKHPETMLLRQPWQNFFFSSLTFPILNEMRLMQAERKRPWVIRFVTHARSKTRSIIAVAVVNLHKRTQCTAVKLHLECGYSSKRENNQTHIATASKLQLLSKHSHSAPAT